MERKGMAVILSPYPITLYWTHTRLNGNKGTLLLCWESYFSHPFIRRMSLSKATQVRAEVWLLGSWQCSRGCGRIQSTELLHITVPLPNMGLCRSLARRLSSSVFLHSLAPLPTTAATTTTTTTPQPILPKVEWKHKELMQGDWMSSLSRLNRCADPRGLVKSPNSRHNQAVLSAPWLVS